MLCSNPHRSATSNTWCCGTGKSYGLHLPSTEKQNRLKSASHKADRRFTPAELGSPGCHTPTHVNGQSLQALLEQSASSTIYLSTFLSALQHYLRGATIRTTFVKQRSLRTQSPRRKRAARRAVCFFSTSKSRRPFPVKPRNATSAQRSHRRLRSGFSPLLKSPLKPLLCSLSRSRGRSNTCL